MAKDILERFILLQWDDSATAPQELAGDLIPGSLSGPSFDHPPVRMTGVSNAAENYLADRPDNEVSARFYMNNTATTGAWTVLNGTRGASGTLTIAFGTGAVATTGDPEYEGEHTLFRANIVNEGGAMAIDVMWKPTSGQTAPAWGTKA